MAGIRLLERKRNGDIGFRKTNSGDVPAYAILSHVWLKREEGEEVLFQDLEASADRPKTERKAGWRKIQFCANQAAADGLQYFWVDTCCIDKKSSAELSAAINSMFRWYQNAARCYVYLSDVPKPGTTAGNKQAIIKDFKTSQWFERGWTLQELIAPKLVDFFCSNGERLRNKLLLEEEVHKVTGIAKSALQGDVLSNFSIRERRSWAEYRHTTVEEDQAYCLLGICNVSMAVIYGEGKSQAFWRLEEKIHKSDKGLNFEQYAVELNLSSLPEAAQFVAREKELSTIHKQLHSHDTRVCIVLHGLSGIGKTQLARQYIKRYKEKYASVFWLNANSHESLRLSFRDIAQQILKSHPATSLLAGIDLDNLDRVEHAAKAWFDLKDNTKWLLIFDNHDNPQIAGNPDKMTVDIRKHLPHHNQGSVIITTRSTRVSPGHRIKVEKLPDIAQSLEILSNVSRRGSIKLDPGAIALAKELDGLPLALATAGAYLEHVTTSFSDYLRLYKASWLKLQQTSPQLESYEDRSLYSTWQVTLDQIKERDPSSARLLKLWAYFNREDVWYELLRHAKSAEDEWIRELVTDELTFNEAVSLLCSFGLVDPYQSLQQRHRSGGYSIHNCIHSWTVSVLNDEWDDDLARVALTCVASEVPSTSDKEWWLLQQRLIHHTARLAGFVLERKFDMNGHDWALNTLGLLYSDQGKLAEAEQMYTRALKGYEEALGAKHTSTLSIVNNLGNLYLNQGKLAEAEQMYTQALQGKKEALGLKHTSTLQTVNNLGLLYFNQGKLAEAEQMYTQALKGYKEALGLKHTSTLEIINNLGNLYADQGKLAEAEQMYIQALEGYEEALGPKYTSILKTVNNLGALHTDQGKLSKAEQMFTRALRGREEALGPKHLSTLDTVSNLGNLYKIQGKLAEAEQMYTRALQGYEEALGPSLVESYLPALNTMFAYGDLFSQTGRKTLAIDMYSQTLSGYQRAQGPSSRWCRALEDRLQGLQAETLEVSLSASYEITQ